MNYSIFLIFSYNEISILYYIIHDPYHLPYFDCTLYNKKLFNSFLQGADKLASLSPKEDNIRKKTAKNIETLNY